MNSSWKRYQVTRLFCRKGRKLVITRRSDKDMYINTKKQLGKDGFANIWRYWKTNSAPVSMELHCDSRSTNSNTQDDKTLNNNAEEFRPKRSAAAVAEQKIEDIVDNQWRHLICIIKWKENNVEISWSRTI